MVEMAMTILLLSIVMAVVYQSISSLGNASETTRRRLMNLDEARVLMANSTKDIRTATAIQSGGSPFLSASNSAVQFYANLLNPGAAASLVNLHVDGTGQLVESVTLATNPATGVPPCTQQPCDYTSTPTTRFVGRFIQNSNVFTYNDVNGNPIAPGNGAALTAAQMLTVRTVTISFSVRQETSSPIGLTTLKNTVGLPNVLYQQST